MIIRDGEGLRGNAEQARRVLGDNENVTDDWLRVGSENERQFDFYAALIERQDHEFTLVHPDEESKEFPLFVVTSLIPYPAMVYGGAILEWQIEQFRYEEQRIPGTRQLQKVKVVRTYVTEEGRKLAWSKPVMLWKFLEDFQSDRLSESEWKKIVKACAPAMARDKKLWEAECARMKVQAAKTAHQFESAADPAGSQARAISEGIAAALARLGVVKEAKL